MTTIQDRIETLKNIFFANGVKCDSEQFLIEDISNLIKEVQEETRKETKLSLENKWKEKIKASDNPWEGLTLMDINEVFNNLSITNKEKQNG